jgi:hypothetical protein
MASGAPTPKTVITGPGDDLPPVLPPITISSQSEDGFTPQMLRPPNADFPESVSSSRPASTGTVLRTGMASSTALPYGHGQQNYFRSRRIKKEEIEQPWLKHKDPREKWVTIIPICGFIIGLGVAGMLVWLGLRTVVNHNYCPVLDETFKSWNDSVWMKEVEVGGFG